MLGATPLSYSSLQLMFCDIFLISGEIRLDIACDLSAGR